MRTYAIIASIVTITGIAAAGSIHVENSDSKDHTVKLNCSGSDKTMEIKRTTTTTYTFHSTHKDCKITGGTVSFPVGKLEEGQKWKIKDGKATAK